MDAYLFGPDDGKILNFVSGVVDESGAVYLGKGPTQITGVVAGGLDVHIKLQGEAAGSIAGVVSFQLVRLGDAASDE